MESYAGGPVLPMGMIAPAQHLPRRERQRGYALLMALAANRGIAVSVSALSNPDFATGAARRHPIVKQRRFDCAV